MNGIKRPFISVTCCFQVNGTLHNEASVFPGRGNNRTTVTQVGGKHKLAVEEEELEVMTATTATNTCTNEHLNTADTSTTQFIVANNHESSSNGSNPPPTSV